MGLEIVLGVLGIAATIIGAVISVILVKRKKYPCQLSYTVLNKSKVLERLPGSFSHSSLKYDDYSVSQELHYIEVMVFNTRSADVGNAKSQTSVTISLQESAKWVDVKVKKETPLVGSTVSVSSEREVQIMFDLLKKNEFIVLEGLVESSSLFSVPDNDLLSFTHHVPNLDKFLYIPSKDDAGFKSGIEFLKIMVIIFLAILSLLLLKDVLPLSSSEIQYRDAKDGKLCSLAVTKDERIIVYPAHSLGFRFSMGEIIPVSEFEDRFSPVPEYNTLSEYYLKLVLLLAVFLLILGALMSPEIRSAYRHKRLKQINMGIDG